MNSFLNIGYGYFAESQGVRDLTYIDTKDGSINKGRVKYILKTNVIEGYIYDYKFRINILNDSIIINDIFHEYKVFYNNSQHNIKIISDIGQEMEVSWNKRIYFSLLKKAYYVEGDKTYIINIARNQTPLDFFKTLFGLFTLGLYRPNFRSVLSENCRDLPHHKRMMLFYCSLLLQIYYMPSDYVDWV